MRCLTHTQFVGLETVFLVADGDVYRSDDGGVTCAELLSIYCVMRSIAVSPGFAADRTVFAVDGTGCLFRSTDDGATWDEVIRVAQVGGASDAVLRHDCHSRVQTARAGGN